MPSPEKQGKDASLVDFRRRLAKRILLWCDEQAPSWSQRQLGIELGYHYTTVNNYLNHPEAMPAVFIEKVAATLPGFEAEWINWRRLEETGQLPPDQAQEVLEREKRRQELHAAIDNMAKALSKLSGLLDDI